MGLHIVKEGIRNCTLELSKGSQHMDSSKEAAFLLQGIDPLEVPLAVAFMEAAAPYMGVKLEDVDP